MADSKLWWWTPYLYLLRVQLIAMTLLVAGPPFALSSPLLNGIFDLDYGNAWRSALAMVLVSLAAFSTAWTLLASCWTTIFNAPARFDIAPVRFVRFPIHWPEREVFGLMALFPIAVAIQHSWEASGVNPVALIAGALVGLLWAISMLLAANRVSARLQRDLYNPNIRRVEVRALRRLVRWLDQPNIREGFIDSTTGHLRPGHMVAWVVFIISLTLYAVIGIGRASWIGYQTELSTLACVLLLILMLCWMLGGLAFFFDRYRVPVLAIVVATLFVIGLLPLPGRDHTYRTWSHPEGWGPYPDDVLKAGSTTPIVIAATGGGIQAAAWTARVLAGIDKALPTRELQDAYTQSIRLISSVSGGGVGAMYFSEKYDEQGNVDHDHMQDVIDKAEASSLDDVAWGAVYPDLIGSLFPPIRLILGDRGQALEKAWTRGSTMTGRRSVGALLADWREQVWAGSRPANIFNATLVDTGERLLLGTSRLKWQEGHGLHNYEDLYRDRNVQVQVVTAARLAASFTYVSPAARPDHGRLHVVDGGYYDDYGMTTLTEWLDEALEGVGLPRDGGAFRRVLVIQIRSSPTEEHEHDGPAGMPGYFYQAWAPVKTLLNVRSTGQISQNDEGFARLQRLWNERGIEIDNVVFRFCGEHPPLSWHLTGRDKDLIEDGWKKHRDGSTMAAVKAFLSGGRIASDNPDKPFDAPMVACTPS
jgi:hypothetical protein